MGILNMFGGMGLGNIVKNLITEHADTAEVKILEMAKSIKLEDGEARPALIITPGPDENSIYASIVIMDNSNNITRSIYSGNLKEFIKNLDIENLSKTLDKDGATK